MDNKDQGLPSFVTTSQGTRSNTRHHAEEDSPSQFAGKEIHQHGRFCCGEIKNWWNE
jgi:hypothetical protein